MDAVLGDLVDALAGDATEASDNLLDTAARDARPGAALRAARARHRRRAGVADHPQPGPPAEGRRRRAAALRRRRPDLPARGDVLRRGRRPRDRLQPDHRVGQRDRHHGRRLGRGGRRRVGGAVGVLAADRGRCRGDLGAGRRRLRCRRRGVAQRADRRRRRRADGRLDPRDRRARPTTPPGSPPRPSRIVETHQRDGRQARHVEPGDRQRGQGDHLDRRADQPAGAQRDHRGRPCRRGRQGLRGRRQRGQGARAGDRAGHRGHRPPGRGDPGRHHAVPSTRSARSPRSSPRSTTTS